MSLTAIQARVLFAIWKLQTTPPVPPFITDDLLASQLAMKSATVRKHLSRLRQARHYLEVVDFDDGKGRPQKSYKLNNESMITFVESAVIALELGRFHAPGTFFRVAQQAFAKHIVKRFGFNPSFVKDRLEYLLKLGYFTRPTTDTLWTSHRLDGERAYLQYLEKEFKSLKHAKN